MNFNHDDDRAVPLEETPARMPPEDDGQKKQRKTQIWKDLILLSIGFLVLYTAFQGLQNIQSSLNSDEGLGTASLSAIYGGLVVSSMFLPSIIIKTLGCKWSLVFSFLTFPIYIAANYYASWYTLIPTAILVGFGGGVLWSASSTYVTVIGHEYAELLNLEPGACIAMFFGVFFTIYQMSQVWGNLLTSLIFTPSEDSKIEEEQLDHCGAEFCNEDFSIWSNNSESASKAETSQVNALFGTYLACGILSAVIIAAFVSQLSRPGDTEAGIQTWHLVIATFRHLRNPKQIFLIPISVYVGIHMSYIAGDYTKAFVNCSMGIHNVGYVMICLGLVEAASCFAIGQLVKFTGRQVFYFIGASIDVALSITMLTWRPDPNTPWIFYVISGGWGMTDAVWQSQMNALYGTLFTDNIEAAFSNYKMWDSIGFTLGFAWSGALCMRVKLYILLSILAIGMLGYGIVEVNMLKKKKTNGCEQ